MAVYPSSTKAGSSLFFAMFEATLDPETSPYWVVQDTPPNSLPKSRLFSLGYHFEISLLLATSLVGTNSRPPSLAELMYITALPSYVLLVDMWISLL